MAAGPSTRRPTCDCDAAPGSPAHGTHLQQGLCLGLALKLVAAWILTYIRMLFGQKWAKDFAARSDRLPNAAGLSTRIGKAPTVTMHIFNQFFCLLQLLDNRRRRLL